ncbi:MAG: M28 family peptidase [Anaerolineae bacterium]|nr:M28 family peptidase [Anaerolineae bacterium]NIN96937.1 M28 family peptidase [Anaerolineae bacterium]NIQ79898.1 M28 family peptidase [Anaerolineae bacterium]
MLAHAQVLAGEIGPRGTGTAGEEAAASYVAERLSVLGLPIERQTFRAVASQNAFPLAIDLLALLAVAIYPVDGAVARWTGAALALSAAPLLWQTIRTSSSPLRPLLPHVTSRNVVARIEPRAEVRQRAVILAHLDTNRCRLAWQSSAVRYVEPLTYLTLALLASLGLLYLAGALLEGPGWVWWVSLLPAGYVVGTVITLWRDDLAPYTPGAHDNAAGVAVALEIGSRLAAHSLHKTEVWLAFTGAEETDHAGLYALLREHGRVLRRAAFVGLEGVGSGEIVYLTRQGVCSHYTPDPQLLALARKVADEHPTLGVRAAWMTMEDEVGTLRRKGFRAICIAGRDPATGTLPHWHRPDDTMDTICPQALDRAVEFVTALLEELDSKALEGSCAPL